MQQCLFSRDVRAILLANGAKGYSDTSHSEKAVKSHGRGLQGHVLNGGQHGKPVTVRVVK